MKRLDPGAYPTLKRGVGFRRLFGEGVALVADTSKVNVLNETACRFLELADGRRTMGEILGVLSAEYEASVESIHEDVSRFLEEAEAEDLVELGRLPRPG